MSEREREEVSAEERSETTEDRVAERFLALEAELANSSEATLPDGTVRRGQITDARRVPVAEIPTEYPDTVGTGQALVLTVDIIDAGEVQLYLGWPEDSNPDADSALGQLLDALDIPPEQLASLYGEQILVEVTDGYHTLYLPAESPRGEPSTAGMLGSLGGSLAALAGATAASSGPLLFGFFLLTFVAVPYFTYRDSWYLRTHSDWDGGPVFWTTLAMIPLLNVFSTALYLAGREKATVFGSS